MSRTIAAMVFAALMLSSAGSALAAEAATLSEEKVLLENDRVKVVEVSFKPGAVDKMKDRSARVVYYFTDAHFVVTTPDGKTMQRDTKAGNAAWRAQDTTEVTNVGKEGVKLNVTYLK